MNVAAPVPAVEPAAEPHATTDALPYIRTLLAFVVLGGFVLRWLAADWLSPQIDEAASVLAARMVAEKGLPLFPSGVLYLQGGTLSYLLQPLITPGRTGLTELGAMRLLCVLASTLVIPVAARLGRIITGNAWLGLLGAALVAADPLSVEWGAHVRPYALLQLLTALLLLLWMDAFEAPSPRRMAGLVAVFSLGVFTHVGIALLWPPMVLVSVGLYGRSLATTRRDLGAALLGCLGAPLAFLTVNRIWGVTTRGDGTSGASFVGDHLLDVARFLAPDLAAWQGLFSRSSMDELMPPFIAAASGLLVGRGLTGGPSRAPVIAALVAYWLPVAVFAFFTSDSQARYLLHVHTLTWILLLTALADLAQAPGRWRPLGRLVAVGGLAFSIAYVADGTSVRLFVNRNVDPNYQAALDYVVRERAPEERVISGMTPVAWLAPVPADELYFLAGDVNGPRARRYTRTNPDGVAVDYWIGSPAITTAAALCEALRVHPGSWIVVDKTRMNAGWAFGGPIADVVRGTSVMMYSPDDAALVFKARPPQTWTEATVSACARRKIPATGIDDETGGGGP